MLPLIPAVVVAAASAVILIRKKIKTSARDALHNELLKFLFSRKVPVDADGKFDPNTIVNGVPLIFSLIDMHEIQCLECLLEYGANPDICNAQGIPAVVYAAQSRNAEDIISILLKSGANPNAMNSEGRTALFYASSAVVVDKLVNAGAVVNAMDIHGRTPIFDVKKPDALEKLISYGADIDVKDENGQTCLFSFEKEDAKSPDIQKCFLILIKYAPSLASIQDDLGNKPKIKHILSHVKSRLNNMLLEAVRDNNFNKMEHALNLGADPNIQISYKDEDGSRKNAFLLFYAVEQNRPDLIKLFAQYGANVNKTSWLDNVVAVAIRKTASEPSAIACLQALIDAGAKVTKGNRIDAMNTNKREIIELVRSAKLLRHPPKKGSSQIQLKENARTQKSSSAAVNNVLRQNMQHSQRKR